MTNETRSTDDPDVSASEIIIAWNAGGERRIWALDKLDQCHAALAAVVIVQGAQDGRLTRSDCNGIANLLVDRRVARIQAPGL